jgi:hypothetical protein
VRFVFACIDAVNHFKTLFYVRDDTCVG